MVQIIIMIALKEYLFIDGVNLSYRPEINPQTGLVTLNMNITDQNTGKPLTHVD